MEFEKLLAQRRSIRKFSDRPVPEEVVGRLLDAALAAPSSHNSRSSYFLVVDEPEINTRMSTLRDSGAAFR